MSPLIPINESINTFIRARNNSCYKGLPVKITHELRLFFRIVLRLLFVRFSFGSRSVLVRFSFGSRLVLDRFSFILRSSSVHSPFGNRRLIEERSKNDRSTNGESSEAKWRCIETRMGNQGKGDFLCSRKVLIEQLMDIDGN